MDILDICFDSNNIWIYSDSEKAIFKVDTQSGCVDLLKSFDKSMLNSYRGIYHFEGIIYLAPQNGATEILIYNIEKQQVLTKALCEKYFPDGLQYNLFTDIIRYKTKLFFIPGRYEAIVILDINTGEISYIDSWFRDIENDLQIADSNFVIFNGITRIDDTRVFINGWKSNVSLVFDMKEKKYEIIKYDEIGKGIRGAVYNENVVLLAYKNKEGIYLKNMNSSAIVKISKLHGRLYSYENKVYVVDSATQTVYKYSAFKFDSCEKVYLSTVKDDNIFYLVKQYSDKLFFLGSDKRDIVILDMKNDDISHIDISKLDKYAARIWMDKNESLVSENETFDLRKLIFSLEI